MATGSYPRIPTFGVPCPTTLLTIGLLLMAIRIRLSLLIIPWLWAVIGGAAALLRVIPDFALIAAAVLVLLPKIAVDLRRILSRNLHSPLTRPLSAKGMGMKRFSLAGLGWHSI